MDTNMNTTQRDPFVRRDADMRQLMTTLKELQDLVANAQMIWGTGRCMVDKKTITDQVDLIARLLPDSMKQAAAIVKAEQQIKENAQREAAEQTNKAREEAQKTIDNAARDAQKTRDENQKAAQEAARANANAMNAANTMKAQAENEANVIRQKAQNDANALYAQAKQHAEAMVAHAEQEAQRIRAQAAADARNEVAKENVYRMAVQQAAELQEAAENEAAAMRQNYAGAVDKMLYEVDEYLVSIVSAIRAERQNLKNRY